MKRILSVLALVVLAGVMTAPAATAASDTPAASSKVAAAAACSTYTARSTAMYSPANGRNQGLMELRYNSCSRIVWARVTTGLPACKPGEDYCGYATVHRNSDGAEKTCNIARGATSCYSGDLNDANVTSYAEGWIDAGAYSYYGKTGSF